MRDAPPDTVRELWRTAVSASFDLGPREGRRLTLNLGSTF